MQAETGMSPGLAACRLKLRSDLVFTPRAEHDRPGYLVEDPLTSKFFRIGLVEYNFMSLLDGRTTVGEAWRLTQRAHAAEPLTAREVESICRWLVIHNLASTGASQPDGLLERSRLAARRRALARYNPIFFRIPLLHPDRFLQAVTPWVGWLFSLPVFVLACAMWAAALWQVSRQWNELALATEGILAPGNWLWLAACWLGLKLLHELSHGVVCTRYGGSVREAGVILLLVAPLAYVDVTNSWRFPSKWQRIHVAAAGIYAELVVAGLAILIWAHAEPGVLSHVAFKLAFMASFSTLLFNANPLMRFDGYYILSDLLGVTNLYSSGQRYLAWAGKRWLLGMAAPDPLSGRTHGNLIRCYGAAALAWRVLACTCLVIAAAALLHGAGIILAAVAVAWWIGWPAVRLACYLVEVWKSGASPGSSHQSSFIHHHFFSSPFMRLAAVSAATLLLVAALFSVVPWFGPTRAPAVVQYKSLAVVRAASPGFVREIAVQDGQPIEAGQVLARLENDQLRLELRDLELAIEQARTKSRVHQQAGHLAAQQAELESLVALETKRAEKQAQVERLTIAAPRPGQVIGRNLDALLGTWLKEGASLLAIGDEREKQLQLSIGQEDLDAFAGRVGRIVTVRMHGQPPLGCPLVKVDPRASLDPPHPAFGAALGGPLPVRSTKGRPGESANEAGYAFLTPRFVGTVELPAAESGRTRAGGLAAVHFRSHSETFGGHLARALARWIERRFAASEKGWLGTDER